LKDRIAPWERELLAVADYERGVLSTLPQEFADYYQGGTLDEITLGANTGEWSTLKLHYRVLGRVGDREMSTTVLGQKISMPICVAPTAFHRLACEEGEMATARAAKGAGTLFILSSLSNTAMEKVFQPSQGYGLAGSSARGLRRDSTGRRTVLVSALCLQGPGSHARARAKSGGGGGGGDCVDGGCAGVGDEREGCEE
jgi:hypothetical protein